MGGRDQQSIPGPSRSSSRRHPRPDPRFCKARQGPMPVLLTQANDINKKYLKPRPTSSSSTSSELPPWLQNWTIFPTPDNPKIVVGKNKNRTSLTYYPSMASTDHSSGQTGKPKIVLHWLEASRAQRIAWLLEELGLQYELKIYKRTNNIAPPGLRAIHPLGKSPVLTIDDVVLAESGFIVEYLTTQYNQLRPPSNTPTALQYQYLLHYAEGSLMPPLVIGHIMQIIKTSRQIPFFVKPFASMIVDGVYRSYLTSTYEANFRYLETLLDGKEWFVGGEFSGVDVLMSYPLLKAAGSSESTGLERGLYPNLYAWIERIKAREAYKRAEARTAKYEQRE